MGTMSASDAAPLPRLGEVFFDVRGSSRSMRLSWYAGTGVSVFSIWQGGTCTGTFRLPAEELSRLIDALQRGVQAADPRGSGAYPSQLPGAPTDPRLTALPGGYGRDVEYTGPITGDFRALRSDDPASTMVFSPAPNQMPQNPQMPQNTQAPRALPPSPLALPPAPSSQAPQSAQDYQADYSEQYYPEQQRYQEQPSGRRRLPADGYGDTAHSYSGQYAGQGQYAEQGQYGDRGYEQAGYQDRGYGDNQQGYGDHGYAGPGHADQGYRYEDQGYGNRGYSDQGYYDQGYGQQGHADQRYGDQGYADPRHGGSPYAGSDRGYASPSSYSGQGYDNGSYQGQGYAAGSYSGPGYDGAGQGYDHGSHDDRGYQGQHNQDQGYQDQRYQDQRYQEGNGSYPGPGHANQSQPGYADQRYQQADTPAYQEQGYGEYHYAEHDYQGQGDAESYSDQGYSTFGYGGQDQQSYRPGQYQYQDQNPDAAADHQAVSSFPYETDPPARREQRRRRGRY